MYTNELATEAIYLLERAQTEEKNKLVLLKSILVGTLINITISKNTSSMSFTACPHLKTILYFFMLWLVGLVQNDIKYTLSLSFTQH